MIKIISLVTAFILTLICLSPVMAGPINMLLDPSANEFSDAWQSVDDAVIEEVDGDLCFVLRNGGTFAQEIALSESDTGKFILLTALASSERAIPYGTITDVPYFYGYMMDAPSSPAFSGTPIISYFNAPSSVNRSFRAGNEWYVVGGIFFVPEHAETIRIMLKQGLQEGVPHTGSAARFDDVGVYLFSSKDEARAFFDSLYYQ